MAPPLSAEIAAQWIDDRTADELIERRRREILARWKIAKSILGRYFPADPPPMPGYHLWLPVPAPWRAEAFAAHARSLGVAVIPAEAFTVGPAQPPRAARVGLGAPRTRADLERGLRRLVQALETPVQETLSIV
jgi:DNA-binding transcriptional MocR family regulator